jgi:group I intron endonuclease
MHYIVYKTTNLINNKTYIGIHQTINLDDGYLGSGLAMKRAIKKYGTTNFKREIIEFCLSYEELIEREKFYVNEVWVKEDSNYNLKTGGQSNGVLSEKSRQKISDSLKAKYKSGELIPRTIAPYIASEEQKKQISETLKLKYENGEIAKIFGREPWNKGKTGLQEPWNKGKTGVQTCWAKGLILGPMVDDHKENISIALQEYYKDKVHPTKGLEPWNKGVIMKQVKCPHCSKLTDVANGKRWHFDNCKSKDAPASSNCADALC